MPLARVARAGDPEKEVDIASHHGNNPAGRREARPSRELDMFHDTNMSVGTPGIGGDVPDKLRDERIAVPWRLSAHV